VLDVYLYLPAVADAAHGGHQAHRLVRLDHYLFPSTVCMAEVSHLGHCE
jgi:hypothetical protein